MVVLFVIVAGFWILPGLSDGLGGGDQPSDEIVEEVEEQPVEQPESPEETPEEEVVETPEAPVQPVSPGGQIWVDPSVYSGLQLGDPLVRFEGGTGSDSGIFVASEEEFQNQKNAMKLEENLEQFMVFVEDVEALYNLYTLDLNALLDASENRTQALNKHIELLTTRYNESVGNYEEAKVIRAEFSEDFNLGEPDKAALEARFFADVNDYRGPKAIKTLNAFIEQSQQQVDLKAKYFAFVKVQNLYEWVLPPLKQRIEDIKLNREALIAGIQVVDVLGSDLDLILGVEDLED